MHRSLTALAFAALAAPAFAQEQTCQASIEGEVVELSYTADDAAVAQNTSLRERALQRFGRDA